MKRLLVMIALGLLMASGAFCQKRWTLSVEESLGVGFGGKEPRVVSTTEFVATRNLSSLFSVGAGIGLRVADAVTDYIVENGGMPTKEYMLEFSAPVFLRLGLQGNKWFVRADGGYAPGLLSRSFPLSKGGVSYPCYTGFFVEPHAGCFLGKHSVIGVGVLFQQCRVTYRTTTQEGGCVVMTKVESKKEFPATLTFRYAYRF